jgi:hypothetical protein
LADISVGVCGVAVALRASYRAHLPAARHGAGEGLYAAGEGRRTAGGRASLAFSAFLPGATHPRLYSPYACHAPLTHLSRGHYCLLGLKLPLYNDGTSRRTVLCIGWTLFSVLPGFCAYYC